MTVIAVVLACLLAAAIGYAAHLTRELRDERLRADNAEQALEASPHPRRRPGQPTNIDAAPARITKARVGNYRRWKK